MPWIAGSVKETTTTTGTGSVTLLGAVSQYRSFATAFGASSTVVGYSIVGQTGTEFETGVGTFNGTSTLSRDRVRSSSNAGALVNFSAGTKDVFCAASAELIDNANHGNLDARVKGWTWA